MGAFDIRVNLNDAIHFARLIEMSRPTFPQSNLTWQILDHAQKNGYAVGAYNWYTSRSDVSLHILITLLAITTTEFWL